MNWEACGRKKPSCQSCKDSYFLLDSLLTHPPYELSTLITNSVFNNFPKVI